MSDEIKVLEQRIEETKMALKAQKMMLSQAKKEEAKKTPFSKTKLGGAWYKTVKAVTSPLARLHDKAKGHLEHPFAMQASSFHERAVALADKCIEVNRGDKGADELCKRLAYFVMEVEDFYEEHPLFKKDLESMISELRDEIDRLRPPRDSEAGKKIEEMANSMVVSLHPTAEEMANKMMSDRPCLCKE